MGTGTETKICLCCRKRHEVKYVELEETMMYKGVLVTYTARYKYCERADALVHDTEVTAANYLALEQAYGKV